MARKILLADDSVTAQNMGRRILTDAGYDVITVNNGSAALKKAVDQKPDLIILDVYMPGYGGLEVCQRLREAQETARIPVLLTVGKLEPFKPDEARRVRADAFIIKPFEASELLAALTKLEDKIVPQGKAGKSSKATSIDSVAAGKGEKFGDSETGWKNRLNIPPRKANEGADAKHEPAETPSAEKKSAETAKEEVKPAAATEGKSGLPTDITKDEIAAIAAAAAAVQKQSPEAATSSSPAAASLDTTAPVAPAASTKEAKPEVAASETKPEAKVDEAKPVEAKAAEAAVTVDAKAESKSATEAEPNKSDVEAALATLAQNSGSEVREEVPVTIGAAADSGAIAAQIGSHWIANEVSVPAEDSLLVLEREMEKAYAAMAATENAHAGSSYSAPAATAVAEAAAVSSEILPSSTVDAVSKTEASASDLSARPADSATAVSTTSASGPDGSTSASAEATPKEVAAYAAAASVSSSGSEGKTKESSSISSTPAQAPDKEDGADREKEAQLAAAWENWQSVRESILGSQIASQLTEAAAAELKEIQKEDTAAPAAPKGEEGASTQEPANPTAIASIVDTVLAELKPKLMEEIAKKLGNEPKK